MAQQQSTANARLAFENAKTLLAAAQIDWRYCKLTNSDLRLEQATSLTKTAYLFPVMVNNNGPANTLFNTEVRLNQQDSFVVASWGWFISAPASATAANAPLQTYPNGQIFLTAGSPAALETVYNSIVQIAVNNDIILPVWHMYRHRMVPQTQQILPAAITVNICQNDGGQDSFQPVEPNIVIIGSKNTVITLTLPVALAVVEPFGRIVTIFRGVLAQNSTSIT